MIFNRRVLAATVLLAAIYPADPGFGFGQGRNNASEAVANLKAYAAYKAGRYDEARALWESLARKGNTTALVNLSNLFQQGQGVTQDRQKALEYVRRGAQLGDARAQFELGMEYEKGQLVGRDMGTAEGWFKKAAVQDDKDAQFALGVLYATAAGKGIDKASPEERRKAISWLAKAHAQGHPEAQTYLDLLQRPEPVR